jgi:putative heme d1 biosynthesis radical SAM protein NirJ2
MLVSWLTTNRCNLKCKHCYQDAGINFEDELSTEEGKKLIDEIARAGFKMMIFSGGEALMRPDIYELVAHASSRGLRPVFGTNGTLLTLDVAKKLKASGAMAMGISLDSLDEKKHNEFRVMEDAFQKTVQSMRNCKEAGLAFQIHTTVLDWNKSEILDIIDFAVEMGAMAAYIFFLVPVGRGIEIESTAVESMEYEKLLTDIMTKQKTCPIPIKPTCGPQFTRIAKQVGVELDPRFSRGCLAGLTYCIITPNGKVKPCAYMVEEAGDVREMPFDEIWKNSELFKTLRTQDYKGLCGKCAYKSICGGCRARASYYHDGDILAEDSYCALVQKTR